VIGLPLILVVDDEEAIVELVAFNLKKEGFEVDTAGDGYEALKKAEQNMPDLIVLDWMLPGIDGLEVCRRLRENKTTRELPIIMLTARGEEVDKILGLEIGANDYVTKPFSPRELTARVRAHLRARRPHVDEEKSSEKAILHSSGLLLDAAKYLVKIRGQTVEMSPKEFELLFLLAANQGRVFRREEILDRVWGYDYPADTRTVDVHIRYLRQKVEDDPNNPSLILTVRGVGYKFREAE
jgi:two-component system alkaline phosphatase synthesis response regulator PhoP